MKGRKRVLSFSVANGRSPHVAFKGRKGSVEAGRQVHPNFRQGPLPAVGKPHPKQPSERRQPEQGVPHPPESRNLLGPSGEGGRVAG